MVSKSWIVGLHHGFLLTQYKICDSNGWPEVHSETVYNLACKYKFTLLHTVCLLLCRKGLASLSCKSQLSIPTCPSKAKRLLALPSMAIYKHSLHPKEITLRHSRQKYFVLSREMFLWPTAKNYSNEKSVLSTPEGLLVAMTCDNAVTLQPLHEIWYSAYSEMVNTQKCCKMDVSASWTAEQKLIWYTDKEIGLQQDDTWCPPLLFFFTLQFKRHFNQTDQVTTLLDQCKTGKAAA